MSGVTTTGFEAETVDTLKTAIEDELKNLFGASFNVRPTSVAGIMIGVIAQKLADVWDAAEAIYGSQYPETAFGASLDQLALLTGVQRLLATHSEATLGVTGTPGTIIPVGSRVQNSDTNTYWRLKSTNGAITIPAASATTGVFESEDFGEIIGLAGSLDTIDTVIAGWSAVNNTLDATLGRELETDAELRLRRAQLLQVQGNGTVDAIRADILRLSGVQQVKLLENVTDVTNTFGLPPHSFEVVVLQSGASSASILQSIWDTKPAGISAYGSTPGYATDSLGNQQQVAYTPAVPVDIYISTTAVTGSGFGATANGVAAIKAAITAYGDTLLIDDDVIRIKIIAAVQSVTGVIDHGGTLLDATPSPTAGSNVTISTRQRARFNTANINVALT